MAEGEVRQGARSWSRRTGVLAALITLLSAAAVHAEQQALLALPPGGAEAEAKAEDTLGNFLPEVRIGWTSKEPKIGDTQDELSLIGGSSPASDTSGSSFQLPRPQFSVTLGSDSSGRRNRGLALEWRLQGPPLLDGTLGLSIRGNLDTFGFHYKLTF